MSGPERSPVEVDAAFDRVAQAAVMVPMLPCGDVDAMAEFWTGLGFTLTYRQRRPNPYVALRRGRIDLHYYGMPDWNPEDSHSTCAVVVPDTEPVHAAFAAGLRTRYGRVPMSGVPRMTRPRPRANNGGLSGFSLIDPAGNWVRVSRAPDADSPIVAGEGATTAWTSAGGGPLARATENAVVLADSHGDVAQARKVLAGALRRAAPTEPVGERAAALTFLVELCSREGDHAAAHRTLTELEGWMADAPTDGRADLDGALAAARALVEDRR